ncbi:MAG: hypothetical protein JWQ68_2541 [Cryobacterium sp.]|jgi:hypothetical protein|nr:hypothetical protein [Cryobacterium sp.]
MSTIKHPVGPQPSTVYWRRRLLVGLGLVAVLVIIFLIVVRPGSSSGEPKQPAPASTDSSSTPTDSIAGAESAAEAAPDGAPCDPDNVKVAAITDAPDYQSDELPQLSVSITNTGKASCSLNAGTSRQVFTITSGEDIYWTSTDCQTDPVDAKVILEPGVEVSSAQPVEWERVRSAPDTCDDSDREKAPAGGASYYLSVSVDGVQSENPRQFLLY